MKTTVSLTIISLVILCCCTSNNSNEEANQSKSEEQPEPAQINKDKHWTYGGETGPEHWAELEAGSSCDGTRQSPINIVSVDAISDTTLTPINVQYSNRVKIHELTNNGHSIQYNFEKGDYITLNNQQYDLSQIHFHEPSEHTINGVRYPLEMHLVHISSDNKIAVLSIMAEEGENSKPFHFLEQYLPINVGETKPVDAYFDLKENLPGQKDYYTYSGSLTTPPCTQDVTWVVYKSPISVSLDQVKQLQELMPLNNYRNEQPINDRIVKQYSSSEK